MQNSKLIAAAFFWFLPSSLAHGFIEFPPLRGGTAGRVETAYCPQCGNGAGLCGDGGQWSRGSDFLNFAPGPVTTLKAGEIAEFRVKVAAHHKGFFEFRICDQRLDGSVVNPEACLNQHRLRRAAPASDCVVNDVRGDCQPVDTRHPGRWYLPPGTDTYTMKYHIPADLRCSSCTLQWQWFTANSCIPGEDTGCYWADFAAQGWNQRAWCGSFCGRCSSLLEANSSSSVRLTRGCGEEFRNCADVAVERAGETMASTTDVATNSEPETEPEVEPEVEPEAETSSRASTTMPPASSSMPHSRCGSCMGCMWSHGLCYMDASKSYCESWSDNTWCGASLAQVQRHPPKFLGLGLIQDGAWPTRGVTEEL